MIKISIRPKSINDCWQGRRFKTSEYKKYRNDLNFLLPKIDVPKGLLSVTIHFGFSNKLSDLDNPVKPILDSFLDKYNLNDRYIYELNLTKEIVPKGKEFFEFSISALK